MTEQKIKTLAIAASLGGLVTMLWYLHHATVGAIAWSCVPYVATLLATLTMQRPLAILGGIVAMLVVDVWMVVESSFHTKSPVLLAASLFSSVKIITLFPLGLLVGYLLMKRDLTVKK